ncbi:hypothetical protein ABZ023_26005 [Streptomyces sp. NPDC006367]|uniref:hypothetical protein n=1 Tax=unclassified Streptomyces TaxID=2593676 RepID=UPI0033A02FA7
MTLIGERTSSSPAPTAGTTLPIGGQRNALETETLPQLVPYTPPLARDTQRCPCGSLGPTCEESMCRPCRRRAVAVHGERLTRLLKTITYDHHGVELLWTKGGSDPTAFTPTVDFTTPDVHDPHGAPVRFRWLDLWADDQLIAACARGGSDDEVLALAVAMAHYALSTLAVHEVGEWYTYRASQVYPPHRPDPNLPHEEDHGPDGNGEVVLWLTYGRPVSPAAAQTWADTPVRGTRLPVRREELGTLPGQTLHLSPRGITVIPPAGRSVTTNAWSAPRDDEDAVAAALRDIHYAMAISELAVVAEHLNLCGQPVFASTPGFAQQGNFLPWDAYLSYDG